MTNKSIAKTIIDQLGGNKLVAMTGAKNFVAIERGVQFKIGRNSKSINSVRIVLNGKDLYDVEFGRVRKVRGVPTYTLVEGYHDAYNDMLVNLFETTTGMYLSF